MIANCIIYYNATLLSQLLAHKENRGNAQGAGLVKQASPVAWQHIHLYGRYQFRKPPEPVNVDEIVRETGGHFRLDDEDHGGDRAPRLLDDGRGDTKCF